MDISDHRVQCGSPTDWEGSAKTQSSAKSYRVQIGHQLSVHNSTLTLKIGRQGKDRKGQRNILA